MATAVCDEPEEAERPSVLYAGEARQEVVDYLTSHGYDVDEFPFEHASKRTKGSLLENDVLLVGQFKPFERVITHDSINLFIDRQKPIVIDSSEGDCVEDARIGQERLEKAGNSLLINDDQDPANIHSCLQRVLGREE